MTELGARIGTKECSLTRTQPQLRCQSYQIDYTFPGGCFKWVCLKCASIFLYVRDDPFKFGKLVLYLCPRGCVFDKPYRFFDGLGCFTDYVPFGFYEVICATVVLHQQFRLHNHKTSPQRGLDGDDKGLLGMAS